jgi:hypothetical protein
MKKLFLAVAAVVISAAAVNAQKTVLSLAGNIGYGTYNRIKNYSKCRI